MMRGLTALFATATVLGLIFGTGVSVRAQTSPPTSTATPLVHLAPADGKKMADALRRVSAQTNVAFVCEGTPFRAPNSDPPLAILVQKWPASGLTLDDAVTQIATVYDYEAERKGNVFLFRKRYTNPEDLPDVTTDELRLALRDASRAASALPAPTVPPATFDEANSPFMAALFKTLPSTMQGNFAKMPQGRTNSISHDAIFSGDFGSIAISSLPSSVKDALWQAAISCQGLIIVNHE